MKKITRLVAAICFVIVVLLLLLNIFLIPHKLKDARHKLKDSESRLEKSIIQLNESKAKMDSMQKALFKFEKYVTYLQSRVEVANLEKKLADSKYVNQRDTIQKRLKYLRSKLKLSETDLPEIPTIH